MGAHEEVLVLRRKLKDAKCDVDRLRRQLLGCQEAWRAAIDQNCALIKERDELKALNEVAKAQLAEDEAEMFNASEANLRRQDAEAAPIPMVLICPICGKRHIDEGEFATKVHHTHACQGCGLVWRPAIVATVGVHFLPGFKNT